MEDVRDFFREQEDAFTIYVVEQKFVVGRGADYFRSYKGKPNYIDTNTAMKKRLFEILQGINKRVPDGAQLIKTCFDGTNPIGLVDAIASLCKLFTVQEHQAAGPEVLDPIIIQEGEILQKYVNQVISLHKESILKPAIIILLKDNNFERAKKLLSGCPHNTNVKMIRNSGDTELFKVINCGVDNPKDFLDAFSTHCFSTCSNTKRDFLYNEEWAENSIIKLYSPSILKIRTNFLYNDKTLVRDDLNSLISTLDDKNTNGEFDQNILQMFQCILRLYRIFCNDGGSEDIKRAYVIAQELNNDIMLAQVYRYAFFFDNYSFDEKLELLDSAYSIFYNNGMEDNAIYCRNNRLVRQFDTDTVNINEFLSLQQEAIHNVPGLVGMSHIFNNVGVAHLMTGDPDESLTYFEKGLDYAHRPERRLQKVALLCNMLIAKKYGYCRIEPEEFFKILNYIFDNKELMNIPFITARYAVNVVSIALDQSKDLGQELLEKYPITNLIQAALKQNILGSGQLILQLDIIEQKHSINLKSKIIVPQKTIEVIGKKKDFLCKTGYNPFIFSTWF